MAGLTRVIRVPRWVVIGILLLVGMVLALSAQGRAFQDGLSPLTQGWNQERTVQVTYPDSATPCCTGVNTVCPAGANCYLWESSPFALFSQPLPTVVSGPVNGLKQFSTPVPEPPPRA